MIKRHQKMIEDAAAKLIAVADDSGECLVSVIADMERYMVWETKVGSPVPPGRRGYRLQGGRIVPCNDSEALKLLQSVVDRLDEGREGAAIAIRCVLQAILKREDRLDLLQELIFQAYRS